MFIYWISGESGCLVSSTDASKAVGQKFVTHADYRELEEHRASVEFLLKIEREAHEATLQELASIKARVGELVVADLALDSLIRTSNEVDKEEYLSAIVRRDDALEDLK